MRAIKYICCSEDYLNIFHFATIGKRWCYLTIILWSEFSNIVESWVILSGSLDDVIVKCNRICCIYLPIERYRMPENQIDIFQFKIRQERPTAHNASIKMENDTNFECSSAVYKMQSKSKKKRIVRFAIVDNFCSLFPIPLNSQPTFGVCFCYKALIIL